jgi:hypothetical protein
MINGIVFPAPKTPSYGVGTTFRHGELVHIPRISSTAVDEDPTGVHYVASLFAPSEEAVAPHFDPFRTVECGEDPTWSVGLLVQPRAAVMHNRLVIYGHPNAVDIGMMYDDLLYFAKAFNCPVLAYEFWGYGLCEGQPSEEDCIRDLRSAVRFAVRTLGFRIGDLVLMGRSIGSGPAVHLAAAFGRYEAHQADVGVHEPQSLSPALLLLEAPFTSIRECTVSLAQSWAPTLGDLAGHFVGDRFRNVDAIAEVSCPIVIVHGTVDTIVPFSHGERLHASANESPTGAAINARVAAARAAAPEGQHVPPHCLLAVLLDVGHNDIPPSATAKAVKQAHPNIFTEQRMPIVLQAHMRVGSFPFDQLLRAAGSQRFPGESGALLSYVSVAARVATSVATLASTIRLAWIEYSRLVGGGDWVELLAGITSAAGLASSSGDVRQPRPLRPWTLPEFVDACVASWGSPLAVYRVQGSQQRIWFGHYIDGEGQPSDEPSYFDQVWSVVQRGGDVGTTLPALEPIVYWEMSSKLRTILAKNIERTSIVALNHPKSQDAVPASATGAGKVAALTTRGHAAVQLEAERFVIAQLERWPERWALLSAVASNCGDGVDLDASALEADRVWLRDYAKLNAACRKLPLLLTRSSPKASVHAFHDAADALRRHSVADPARTTVHGDETGSSSERRFIPRPDPHTAPTHPRDEPGAGAAAQPAQESEAARALRLLRERKAGKRRSSDSDCVVC